MPQPIVLISENSDAEKEEEVDAATATASAPGNKEFVDPAPTTDQDLQGVPSEAVTQKKEEGEEEEEEEHGDIVDSLQPAPPSFERMDSVDERLQHHPSFLFITRPDLYEYAKVWLLALFC